MALAGRSSRSTCRRLPLRPVLRPLDELHRVRYDLAPAPVRENLIANSGPVLAEWDPHPFGVMHEHVPTRSLPRIEIPVTWVLGGESSPWMATLHSHAVRHLPRVETVVVEKAGHLVHLDQPAAFIEAVAKARRSDAPDSRMSGP